jgi:hypothetical protein
VPLLLDDFLKPWQNHASVDVAFQSPTTILEGGKFDKKEVEFAGSFLFKERGLICLRD